MGSPGKDGKTQGHERENEKKKRRGRENHLASIVSVETIYGVFDVSHEIMRSLLFRLEDVEIHERRRKGRRRSSKRKRKRKRKR